MLDVRYNLFPFCFHPYTQLFHFMVLSLFVSVFYFSVQYFHSVFNFYLFWKYFKSQAKTEITIKMTSSDEENDWGLCANVKQSATVWLKRPISASCSCAPTFLLHVLIYWQIYHCKKKVFFRTLRFCAPLQWFYQEPSCWSSFDSNCWSPVTPPPCILSPWNKKAVEENIKQKLISSNVASLRHHHGYTSILPAAHLHTSVLFKHPTGCYEG